MPCIFKIESPSYSPTKIAGCQFLFNEDDLILVNEQIWCPYHCPMMDRLGIPTIKARWDERQHLTFHEGLNRLLSEAKEKDVVLDFTGVVFPKNLDFANTEFPKVLFNHATFGGLALFKDATFGEADFVNSVFREEAIFESARFSKAGFGWAMFHGRAEFSHAIFEEFGTFGGAKFEIGGANFSKATFGGPAQFNDVAFRTWANFEDAAFGDRAVFGSAVFHSFAWFQASAKHSDDQAIQHNTFGLASFIEAHFLSDASFVNRRFLEPARFNDCIFEKAPEFHGCSIHEGSTFPPRENFRDVQTDNAAHAYRTLKRAMRQLMAKREEAMFSQLEQESLSFQDSTPWFHKVTTFLYKTTTNYGESFVRPLAWLFITSFFFFFLYTWIVYEQTGFLSNFTECFQFTIEQITLPFTVWGASGGIQLKSLLLNNSSLVLFVQLLATIQSVFSWALVSLVLLALRRRYKLE